MAICKKCKRTLISAEYGEDYCELCQFKNILKENKINPNSKVARELKRQIVVWR